MLHKSASVAPLSIFKFFTILPKDHFRSSSRNITALQGYPTKYDHCLDSLFSFTFGYQRGSLYSQKSRITLTIGNRTLGCCSSSRTDDRVRQQQVTAQPDPAYVTLNNILCLPLAGARCACDSTLPDQFVSPESSPAWLPRDRDLPELTVSECHRPLRTLFHSPKKLSIAYCLCFESSTDSRDASVSCIVFGATKSRRIPKISVYSLETTF